MKLLPEYLGGGIQQMDRALPDSIRWALPIPLLTVDVTELIEVVDAVRRTDGLLSIREVDGFDEIGITPMGFWGRGGITCRDRGTNLLVTAKPTSSRWKVVNIEVGRLRDGRGTQPGDAKALADTMRESLAAASLLLHRVKQSGDPLDGRLQHHWLREVSAAASLQAGSLKEGRTQPVVSVSSPLMGEYGARATDGWRPNAAMRKHIDDTIGGSVCIQTADVPGGDKAEDGTDLAVTFLPHQTRAVMPSDPVDAMRRIRRMMPADADWVEIMP